ncbi:MAG: YncE family protein [Ignavibacteria bacterium]
MKKIFILICVIILTGKISFSQINTGYRIANKFQVEGEGGWDFINIDESTGRLFISHSTVVNVIDSQNGKLIGTIPDTKGVHGIAIANDLNKGFISNGRDSSVTVFDLQTLKFITKVNVTGINPDAILYDPYSRKIFVFNAKSNNATVIDGKSNEVTGTIQFPGNPEVGVTDGKGNVFVNIEDISMICKINPMTLNIEQSWSVAPGEEPSGLAIDAENHRLFSVCSNKLMVVVNSDDGSIVTTLPIGERVDGAAFDSVLKRAYSSNGEGSLTVVQEEDANTFNVLENVDTQKGARTLTLDNTTHHIYLPTAEFGAPPEPTADNPHPRPAILPNTFVVLDIEPVK